MRSTYNAINFKPIIFQLAPKEILNSYPPFFKSRSQAILMTLYLHVNCIFNTTHKYLQNYFHTNWFLYTRKDQKLNLSLRN